MTPSTWARAIHVRLDVRGMLRDLADIADRDGKFEIALVELMGLSSTPERSVQRMLAYLETVGAVQRRTKPNGPLWSKPGRRGLIIGRLQIEIDPSDIQHIINVAAPKMVATQLAAAAHAEANGVNYDTISTPPGPGYGATNDTISAPYGDKSDTISNLARGRGSPVRDYSVPPSSTGSNGRHAPALLTSPTLTEEEQTTLRDEYAARFAAVGLGQDAITRAFGLWAISEKALRFPYQFPSATSWQPSAADWLEHDLRYLADERRRGSNGRSVPPARGRPAPVVDYGFSSGRVIGETAK